MFKYLFNAFFGRSTDSRTLAIGMMLGAWLLGFAVEVTHGTYSIPAFQLLALAIAAFVLAAAVPPTKFIESLPAKVTIFLLAFCVLSQVLTIPLHNQRYVVVNWGASAVGALALLQVLDVPKLRTPLIAATLIVFSVVASLAFLRNWKDPQIDVFLFQQHGADALLHGRNPYTMRLPSLYGQMHYGRGVVDANNLLTFGFPYPPLSLLMVLPGYVIGGDSRYVDVIAVAATAGLMAAAWPGRWNGLMAALFLLTPTVFFVLQRSWTEPLLLLAFSVVMFCALRWRAALPYAFGLFLATKQYTFLAIPLVWLLLEEPRSFRQLATFLTKSALVAVAISLPFFLWNPTEFYRSVVLWQLLQPMRQDALSYLIWFHEMHPRIPIYPTWTPFAAVIPVMVFCLRRGPYTPAGFAAAVTLVYVVFFATNKQAFCNYYYLVIGTACWAAAAVAPPVADRTRPAS